MPGMNSAKRGERPRKSSVSGAEKLEHALRVEARARQHERDQARADEHERIAAGLEAGEMGERELIRAREQVAKWERHEICSHRYVEYWRAILAGSALEVARRMRGIEASERAALYQNTPFGFLLSERVRR